MNFALNAIDRRFLAILQDNGRGSATSMELDRGWPGAGAID